jgi:hypothetical protein
MKANAYKFYIRFNLKQFKLICRAVDGQLRIVYSTTKRADTERLCPYTRQVTPDYDS